MWKHQDVFVKFSISWYSLKPPEMKKCYFLQEISEAINFYSLPFSRCLNTEWAEILRHCAVEIAAAEVMLSPAGFSEVFCICSVHSHAEQRQCCKVFLLYLLCDIPCGFIDTLVKRHTSLEESCSLNRLSCVCVRSHFMDVLILHRLITPVLQAAWKIAQFPQALYFVSLCLYRIAWHCNKLLSADLDNKQQNKTWCGVWHIGRCLTDVWVSRCLLLSFLELMLNAWFEMFPHPFNSSLTHSKFMHLKHHHGCGKMVQWLRVLGVLTRARVYGSQVAHNCQKLQL